MIPEISIIVPIYNMENYLHKCINSILNQTFKQFELLLINDGSTDKSEEICKEFLQQDIRVKNINKKNGGLSSARNLGIDNANGKYIIFIDSDDFIHERMVEFMYRSITENNADLAICKLKRFEDESEVLVNADLIDKIYQNKPYNNIEALYELNYDKSIEFTIACNKIYNKNLFENLRYKEGKIHEDAIIIHRIIYRCEKIMYIPEELYYYRQTNNSIMRSRYNVKRLDILYALGDRIEFLKKINQKELYYLTEKRYIEESANNYYTLYRLFENKYKKEMIFIKRNINKKFINTIKNPKISIKYKVFIVLFIINPHIYKKIKLNLK